MNLRRMIWMKIANDWQLPQLTSAIQECGLGDLNRHIDLILKGKIKGRVVVKLAG
jgi:acrylyl-CoA reductase (NADPH)